MKSVRSSRLLLATAAMFVAGTSLNAQNIIYTNQACFCSAAHIVSYDKTTGAVVKTYSGVAGNGRGVVVIGDIIYYTMVDDSHIYKMDVNTGLSLGSINTALPSMSTLGWDGFQFWASDYTGLKNAYRIDMTGALTKTVSLSLAGNYYDGLEYFNGFLIANRGDIVGPYDKYDLDGNLIQANFINPTFGPTGIAFDGTNFFVSSVRETGYGVYSGTTGAFINFVNYADRNTNIEDLSFNYNERIDTGPTVPEPATVILMAAGLAAVAVVRRKVTRSALS